ncbi:MAG: carbon monoxide dehydrogenase, partial [bacterium]|nr:carbon monoxide dehydrogenase [bacterium]
LKKDVLVVQTGCSAIASAKAGLLKPESAFKYAGKGLQEICEAVGIPPVLHVGSCVDNSRILIACCEMVKEGGIGDDICELPVAAAAPEAMSEKSLSISAYAVGSGIFTVYSPQPKVSGSENVMKFLCDDIEKDFGATFAFEEDPVKAGKLIIDHLDKKRSALKLNPMMYENAE